MILYSSCLALKTIPSKYFKKLQLNHNKTSEIHQSNHPQRLENELLTIIFLVHTLIFIQKTVIQCGLPGTETTSPSWWYWQKKLLTELSFLFIKVFVAALMLSSLFVSLFFSRVGSVFSVGFVLLRSNSLYCVLTILTAVSNLYKEERYKQFVTSRRPLLSSQQALETE